MIERAFFISPLAFAGQGPLGGKWLGYDSRLHEMIPIFLLPSEFQNRYVASCVRSDNNRPIEILSENKLLSK
jgi:hypothetical protein